VLNTVTGTLDQPLIGVLVRYASRLPLARPKRLRDQAAIAAAPRRHPQSAEDVPEAGAVAEVRQLGAERRAMGAVLRAGHVAYVGLPAARVAAAL